MNKNGLIFFAIMFLWQVYSVAFAQDTGGKVILDLKDDALYEYDQRKFLPTVATKGYQFVSDVKQYDEQLSGDSIEKDFSEDIKSKYPDYSEDAVKSWHKYVKVGVKAVRFYKDIKQKVKDWILNYELPIIASDDQYEMGEDEEYIETDEPLIRENFKKIVAYSNSDKDKLAVREKYAKDNNLVRPSAVIKWYRENIAQGNWKKLFIGFWDEKYLENKDAGNEKGVNEETLLHPSYVMMMKYKGFTDDGIFEGVADITPPKGKVVLLNNYRQFHGLQIDFGGSENVANIDYYLVNPHYLRSREGKQILFYGKKFPVYFKGKVQDVTKKIKLHLTVKMNSCREEDCEVENQQLDIKISPVEEKKITDYATYIDYVAKNIPSEKNKKRFSLGNTVWEDYGDGMGYVRVEFSTKDNVMSKIFMIGEAANFFSAPNVSLNGGNIVARFELLDGKYDPVGKELNFWMIDGDGRSYITKQKVTEESLLNGKRSVSFGVLLLAVLSGVLLNLMPCVFPLLMMKIMVLAQYGRRKITDVRKRFSLNCLGIIVASFFVASLLGILKASGMSLGWGMQFRSVIFMALLIWLVVVFLAYLLGLIRWNDQLKTKNFAEQQNKREKWFEFLSGVGAVILSVPCSAPYLGMVLGIAFVGETSGVVCTVMSIGLGLAVPYGLIALFPKIAMCIPKPGKWLKIVKLIMILMLLLTIIWFLSLLAMQSNQGQIWHWLLYISTVLGIAKFNISVQKAIAKFSKGEAKITLSRKYKIICLSVMVLIVLFSFIDIRSAYNKYNNEIIQSKMLTINLNNINEHVAAGNKVLVKVDAEWCLTCKYNDKLVLGWEYIQDEMQNNNVVVMNIDGTNYDEQILRFMQRYGRSSIPFYVLFSKKFREGIVLPEILDKDDFVNLIKM